MSTKPDALHLADAMAEDILNTPDDEVLREVEEDYGDRRALANKFDQILERAEKQVFGTAPPAASSQVRSSVLDLLYRLLEWFSTVFGSGPQFQLSSINSTVWVGAAAVLIVLILGPAVFLSMSEFNERSRQLAALEKEQLARSEQLAAQEKELLARSEQLAAQEKELLARSEQLAAPLPAAAATGSIIGELPIAGLPQAPNQAAAPAEGLPQTQARVTESKPSRLCAKPAVSVSEYLWCFDADLEFWQNLVRAIYQYRWQQLDTNGQKRLRQGQLDWLRNMPVNCNAAFQVPVSGTEMARAKSCVLQSTKKRVAALSNN
jgi:hypothetical protein